MAAYHGAPLLDTLYALFLVSFYILTSRLLGKERGRVASRRGSLRVCTHYDTPILLARRCWVSSKFFALLPPHPKSQRSGYE